MSNQTKPKKEKRERMGRPYLGKKILRILSATAQTLDSFGNFAYNPYPYIYSSLGHVHDKETIDEAVEGLVKKGLVEKSKTEGLRLTLVGAEVKEKLIRVREKEWDGEWRVVFFDIPEAQRKLRDDLRSELKKLGFGLWQRSAWLTPFDIAEELSSYLRKEDLFGAVQILVGKRLGELDDRDFAAKVWPLKELNERYRALLGVWEREIGKESTAEERFATAASLHGRYLDLLVSDPQLPSGLLPNDWAGGEAKRLFKKLKSTLVGGKTF